MQALLRMPVLTTLFFFIVITSQANAAQSINLHAVGLRAGFSAGNRVGYFEQYELFAVYTLPWIWHVSNGWRMDTRLHEVLGTVSGEGETSFIISIGPTLALVSPGNRFVFEIGSYATGMNEFIYSNRNFGSQFQFTIYAGVGFRISPSVGVSYRYQHRSNAGLFQPNPGLNLHMVDVSYIFSD